MCIPRYQKNILAGLAVTAITLTNLSPDLNQNRAYAAQDEVSTNDAFFTAITEDIEIMERILNKSLQEHFAEIRDAEFKVQQAQLAESQTEDATEETTVETTPAPGNSWAPFYRSTAENYETLLSLGGTYAGTTTSLNLDSFYIPAIGVVYTLNFSAAVTEEEKPNTEAEDSEANPDDDLWQQTEENVRSNTSETLRLYLRSQTQDEEEKVTYIIDEEALNDTIDVIIATFGKYGSKIDDLGQSESIIVVAQVRGSLRSANLSGNPLDLRWRYFGAAIPNQRLVINVPVAALRGVADGSLKFADLRNRVAITMYDDSPSASRFISTRNLFPAPTSSGR